VHEIGQGIYGFLQAHAVHIDADDNIWTVDEAANQVVKFSPDGRVLMLLGRKPEAVNIRVVRPPAEGAGRGARGGRGGAGGPPGAGLAGEAFDRPSDLAWDAAANVFVADGHGANARIAKFDRNGRFIASWGHKGSGESEFNLPHSIAVDAQGNVYVAD